MTARKSKAGGVSAAPSETEKPSAVTAGETAPLVDPRKPRTRVRAGTLAAALKDVVGIIAGRVTIPILGDVIITANDGHISLVATDLDMQVTRKLASDDRGESDSAEWVKGSRGFTIAVPGKPLHAIVKGFDPDAMVTIEAPDGATTMATIKAGRARFRLATLPQADFPYIRLNEVECDFELPCAALADELAAVGIAVSTEPTRFYLNGVFWHVTQREGEPQKLCFAATDGARLARLAREVPEGAAALRDMIVPRQTIGLLDDLLAVSAKADGDGGSAAMVYIEVFKGASAISFEMATAGGGEIRVITKLIDGTFPDYNRVIPTANDRLVRFERVALDAAIKRLSVIAPKESKAIKASFDDSLCRLSVANVDIGDAAEEVPCDWADGAFEIGFNGGYWREALGAIGADEVIMAMRDSAAPVLLVAADDVDAALAARGFVQVLMPMAV